MAETPTPPGGTQPPGWPFGEELPEIPPPAASTPGPTYEPPSSYEPPAPSASQPPTPSAMPPAPSAMPPPPSAMPPAPSAMPPPPGTQPPPPPGGRVPRLPPQRRKRKSPWRTVFIVLAVLAIPVGACGVWLVSVTKPPIDESNRFLAAVDRGDYDTAAAMSTCGISVSDLEDIFNRQDIEYDLKSSNVTNGSSATVSGSITVPNTYLDQISLTLLKFGDQWSVCTFFVN